MQYPEEGAFIVPKRQLVPGTERLRQRVQVSFDFYVIVNDAPIHNSINDANMCAHDLALLQQFLVADKTRLLEMMVDAISIELGMNSSETFMDKFLGQGNFNSDEFEQRLFGPAIDQLEGEHFAFWQDVRTDWLSLCTENIFKCFSAEFVSSSYEFAGEEEHDN